MPAALSGLSVLTPAAWSALLALAIPLLIHLFSRSRGRLVHTGHIDLIRQARRVKVTELRVTQWLLLLLRLGIFTLAALILANLVTAGLDSSSAPTVYLTPGWVRSASAGDKAAVFKDSESGPPTRYFMLQHGFPETGPSSLEALTQSPGTGHDEDGETWALLAERLSLERHRGPVTVYATDRVLQFGRDKPALPGEITWHVSHPRPAATPVPPSLHALIAYDEDRAAGARLFEAALKSLREQRLPGLSWESTELDRLGATPPDVDWLIRLGSGVPSPAQFERSGAPLVILSDAADDGENPQTRLLSLPFYPFSQFRVDRLSQEPPMAPGRGGVVEWRVLLGTDALAPVLEEARVGQVRLLQFNSRFDPVWSSLAEQPEFPELLLQLMLDPGLEVRRFADARIDPAGLPAATPVKKSNIPLPHRSLQRWFAMLLVVLWILERWLSERRPREAHG